MEIEGARGDVGRISEESHPDDQSPPLWLPAVFPTCSCRGSLGLEHQNIITKRDSDVFLIFKFIYC